MFDNLKNATRSLLGLRQDSTKSAIVPIDSVFGGLFGKGQQERRLQDYASYLAAGSRKCWALFFGSHLTASVAMDTPFRLQKKGGDGKPIIQKEILALLTNPNVNENFSEMLYKIVCHLRITGNAFIAKDIVNHKGERPEALYLLNPKRVTIHTSEDEGVIGYTYKHEGLSLPIPFPVAEIIHIRIPHPNNDFWGLGVVEAGEDVFQSYIDRNLWEKKFWTNGASPSGILILEDQVADAKQWEEAKLKWRKEYSGSDNSGKIAWLTGKWKYQQLGLTAAEMQNIEAGRWTVEQIFMIQGVPLSVAGLKDAANYATARQDDIRFRRYGVKPLLKFIADSLNSDLIEGFDKNLELVFDLAGLTDLDSVRENLLPAFDRGAMSINELRLALGLTPDRTRPEWEACYITAAYVPLELAGVVDLGKVEDAARGITARAIKDSLTPPARNGQ